MRSTATVSVQCVKIAPLKTGVDSLPGETGLSIVSCWHKGVVYATDAIRLLALNPEVDCRDIVLVTIGGQIDTTDFDAFGIRHKSLV